MKQHTHYFTPEDSQDSSKMTHKHQSILEDSQDSCETTYKHYFTLCDSQDSSKTTHKALTIIMAHSQLQKYVTFYIQTGHWLPKFNMLTYICVNSAVAEVQGCWHTSSQTVAEIQALITWLSHIPSGCWDTGCVWQPSQKIGVTIFSTKVERYVWTVQSKHISKCFSSVFFEIL